MFIILVIIVEYFSIKHWCLFYWWLLMAIGGYFIGGYFWLF